MIDGPVGITSSMHRGDLLKTSIASILRNKARSVLTILGIVIGIAAVILMLSIGQGAQQYILNQVSNLGSDVIFIEPASGEGTNGPPDPFVEQTLTIKDATALEKSPFLEAVSAVYISSAPASHEETSKFAQIAGVDEDYLKIFPADIGFGRFLDASDVSSHAKVAVLGIKTAKDLFGDQDPIGGRIQIKNTTLRVIGVFTELGTQFFQNLDERIVIPVTTATRDIFGADNVSFISARASGDIELAKEETQFILRDRHNINNPSGDVGKDDFAVSSQSDAVATVAVVGNTLSILLASIAAISLVVGGIGIMNIMLVSVTERTREIGLRKAVGATRREILLQFLYEAVLLTSFGGVVGVALGVAVSWTSATIVAQFVDKWQYVLPPEAIFLGVLVATVVGLVFGVYPARRAAKLDPIEALRYE